MRKFHRKILRIPCDQRTGLRFACFENSGRMTTEISALFAWTVLNVSISIITAERLLVVLDGCAHLCEPVRTSASCADSQWSLRVCVFRFFLTFLSVLAWRLCWLLTKLSAARKMRMRARGWFFELFNRGEECESANFVDHYKFIEEQCGGRGSGAAQVEKRFIIVPNDGLLCSRVRVSGCNVRSAPSISSTEFIMMRPNNDPIHYTFFLIIFSFAMIGREQSDCAEMRSSIVEFCGKRPMCRKRIAYPLPLSTSISESVDLIVYCERINRNKAGRNKYMLSPLNRQWAVP